MNKTSRVPASHKFEVTQTIQPESREAITRGLTEFNARHLGDVQWQELDVYLKNSDGQVVGGLLGTVALGWFSIHALWVTDALRGHGIGSEILEAAEDAARQAGCRAAILDTLSFQAPVFYEHRGYVRIGVVEDYRGGAQRIFMQKRLQGPSASGG